MRFYTNKFCVYYHAISGKCIYIGMGNYDRAFNTNARTQVWKDLVKKNKNSLDVRIAKWFKIRSDAREFEAEKIKLLKPICNLMHNGYHENNRHGRKNSPETNAKISRANKNKFRGVPISFCKRSTRK